MTSREITDRGKLSSADTIAWLLFCATCVYLVSLQPYVVLIPGERGNIFAGFVCAVTLGAALLVASGRSVRLTRPEILISLGLLILAVMSGLLSATPLSSFIRVLVVLSSALGGFWCARILLNNAARQKVFAWLCAVTVSGLIFLALWGYHVYGRVDQYIFLNSHQIIHMTLLLLVGPLALSSSRKVLGTFFGILLTALCCVVLFLSAMQSQVSGVIVPLGAVFILALLGIFRAKTIAGQLLLLLAVALVAAYVMAYLNPKDTSKIEYQQYRIESYPYSWHVVKKHPLLGVGLRTPREEFLADYEVKHPAYPREQFASDLHTLVTPENAFLALLTGVGAPFLFLYGFGVVWLLAWLIRNFFRSPPAGQVLPSWALLVPLLGSLLHSLTTDTLMLPQIVWYFHLLLGLIPKPEAVPARYAESWEAVAVRVAGLVGALAVGLFLGTQPYFSPEKLPKADEIHALLKEVPVIKLLYVEKKPPDPLREQPVDGRTGRGGQQTRETPAGAGLPDIYGTLIVNIEGYKGAPVDWAIMTILDNSKSMTEEFGRAGQTRRDVALDAVESLARAIPPSSRMAVRAFSYDGVARKKSKEIPLRVSRVLMDWTNMPSAKLQEVLKRIAFRDDNNLCAATSRSLQNDFNAITDLTRRVVLVTDGHRECSFKEALRIIEKEKMRDDLRVDVLAIDMPRSIRGPFSRLAADTGGIFVNLASPGEAGEALSGYFAVLQTYRPQPLEVLAANSKHRVLPGEKSRLSPGSYTIALPEIAGLDPTKRRIRDVKIVTGKTTVLNISDKQEELVIQ